MRFSLLPLGDYSTELRISEMGSVNIPSVNLIKLLSIPALSPPCNFPLFSLSIFLWNSVLEWLLIWLGMGSSPCSGSPCGMHCWAGAGEEGRDEGRQGLGIPGGHAQRGWLSLQHPHRDGQGFCMAHHHAEHSSSLPDCLPVALTPLRQQNNPFWDNGSGRSC